jgi:uncharacterized protein YndB with AHSA1/START domain
METTEFVYAIYIRTTTEKLWDALTSGDFSEKYWFGFRFERPGPHRSARGDGRARRPRRHCP